MPGSAAVFAEHLPHFFGTAVHPLRAATGGSNFLVLNAALRERINRPHQPRLKRRNRSRLLQDVPHLIHAI
jgi:hypothetical protein